ncbi:MAG TPA: NADH-quinone oxidoreductase subunit L [Vicinamibacterales bacterium]|nr:NADH-quinone oxidoreductase subunit L [Vicinamibacterales bacterium]
MLLLIPLLPFAGFVINALLGRRLPKSISGGLACLVMLASLAISAASVWTLVSHPDIPWLEATYYRWMSSGDLQIPVQFRLDHLSALMILVVTGIGSLIHIYSTAYMHEETDGEYARYFSYLNLFAAFMLVLVLGSTFPVMFVGWEGVGLCSYLLIGFWYKKRSAADAGKKAFVVNRIGDFGFILGMLLIFSKFTTLDFQAVAANVNTLPVEHSMGWVTVATLLLFLGATGKSAQIPLYTWLPDAMEGPTPVSALIHAATMVTAGVYMIGRNAVLFQHTPITLAVVAGIGIATALMAGTIGLVQNDIKRVLAYSTVSQLGYMFLAMGVGAYAAGIFHLYTHAFFKALLFLGSGAVIHALAGEQDIRNMGGLKKALPITYWTFLIGAIAIAGVPPLAGFFSKDEILWRTFAGGHRIMWIIGLVTSFLTATYMFRLVFLTFHGERRHDAPAAPAHPEEEEPAAHGVGHAAAASASSVHSSDIGHRASGIGHGHGAHLHDAPPAMTLVLIVLAIGSVLAGLVGIPHVLGGGNRIERFLDPAFEAHEMAPATEFQVSESRVRAGASPASEAAAATREPTAEEQGDAEWMLMLLSSGIAVAGIVIAAYFWLRNRKAAASIARGAAPVYTLLLNKYYVDELYNALVVQPIKQISTLVLWKGADAGLIDGTVNGVGFAVRESSGSLRRLQSGSIRAYAASLFFGVILILGWYLLR